MTVQNNQGRGKKSRRRNDEEAWEKECTRKRGERETRTSTACSHREMTPGHPEASGLSGCLGKPRTHLMTPAWSMSHRFFLSRITDGEWQWAGKLLRLTSKNSYQTRSPPWCKDWGWVESNHSKLLRSYDIRFPIICREWCKNDECWTCFDANNSVCLCGKVWY